MYDRAMRILCGRCGAALSQTHHDAGAGTPLCGDCVSLGAIAPERTEGLGWTERRDGDAWEIVLSPPRANALTAVVMGAGLAGFMAFWQLAAHRTSLLWVAGIPLDVIAALLLTRGLLGVTESTHLRLDARAVTVASRPLAVWRRRRVPTGDVEGFVLAVERPLIGLPTLNGGPSHVAPPSSLHHRIDLAIATGERVQSGVVFTDLEAARRVIEALNSRLESCRANTPTAPFR